MYTIGGLETSDEASGPIVQLKLTFGCPRYYASTVFIEHTKGGTT